MDYHMKIKSLMKIKEVRKIQLQGCTKTDEEDEEHDGAQKTAAKFMTKSGRDNLELRNIIKEAINYSETRNAILFKM